MINVINHDIVKIMLKLVIIHGLGKSGAWLEKGYRVGVASVREELEVEFMTVVG